MQYPNSSISSFKRLFIAILLPLIVTIAVGGYLFNYFFEKNIILHSSLNGGYKINRIINYTDKSEIPIFGSSRAETVIIPDSLGNNYFNYGLSGTGYDVTLFFLDQECKKDKITPWILLNFDLEGLNYSIGDVSNYIVSSANPDVKKLLGSNYKGYFSIPFIKYYGRYENYFRLYLSNKLELTKLNNKGASLEKNVLTLKKFESLVALRKSSATTFSNNPLLQQKLLNIIVTHPNRKFVFIIAPYHESYFDKFTNLASAIAYLDTLGKNKNVVILNYSKLHLPDSMFLNTTHLNVKGAFIFNHLLKDTLSALDVH